MKIYKPNYSTLILLGIVFVVFTVIIVLKSNTFDLSLYIGIIVFMLIFSVLELTVFMRSVELNEGSMKVYTGLGYLLRKCNYEIKYGQIKDVNEMISTRAKFSNLKIFTENKQYMIFISGIQDYAEMKAEIEKRIGEVRRS